MKFTARIFLALPVLLWLPALHAETRTVIHTFSTGTGFFIDRDGHLLTSKHVIEKCQALTVAGSVQETPAAIIATDAAHDLALLKSSLTPYAAASLSSEKQPQRVGDAVVIIGYPGQSWQSLQTVVAQAQIRTTMGPKGDKNWFGFTDVIAKGNSGGPLLDATGNVIGVIAAKGQLYKQEEGARPELVDNFALAVSLPVVRAFLDKHDVRYQEADSGIAFSSGYIADMARRYIVNVRCRVR